MSKNLNLLLLTVLFLSLSTNVFAAKKKSAVVTESTEVHAEQAEPITPQEKIIPGRYQLFQGKYRSTNIVIGADSKTEYTEGLFLLDTSNGDLFICESLAYANSESNSKAVKGFLYKRHCSPFKDELGKLKDEGVSKE